MAETDGPRMLPDYRGGSIVNLMASIIAALGGRPNGCYPPLRALDPTVLTSRNVVLLVIDGMGYDYLLACSPDGELARHVQCSMTSVFPSTTASAVTTFLTGEAPQQHGVTGWFTYFRELGGLLAVLPYRPRHGGAAPSVEAQALFAHVPVFDRLKARSHVVVPREIAHSHFNRAHNGKAVLHPFIGLEQLFEETERIIVGGGQRNYVYAYWPELDRLAHEHGIGEHRTVAHLRQVDAAFSRFLDRIDGTDTTVIVTADHGFIDADPSQAADLVDHPLLERMLVLPLAGERRVAYCYLRAGCMRRFTDYVHTHLAESAELHDSDGLVKSGWFGLGPPHPRLRERVGDCTLLMRRRGVVQDAVLGEERHRQIGVHGGLSREEMLVPLIVLRV